MTDLEKINEIAEYDFGGKENITLPVPDYLRNLNALHMVAMKLMDDLQSLFKPHNEGNMHSRVLRTAVMCSCSDKPVNGEFVDLFSSVYDGVSFIKKHKDDVLS